MLPHFKKNRKYVYLDYAATTPVDPAVVKAMKPFWSKVFGNPSSLYKAGRGAKAAVDSSRAQVAGLIGARPEEIIFTAGGTESCNLAISGIAKAARLMNTDSQTDEHKSRPHIITSAIEHHAVLNPIEALKGEGFEVTVLGVDQNGLISIAQLQNAIKPETVLVSLMYANNEIGTIEPVVEAGKMLTKANISRQQKKLPKVLLHSDACQAAGALDINVNHLNVDLMSVNASKIYGPKQVGFLYVRNGTDLKPITLGGGQEKGLRSGTENVPGIVGFAKALGLAQKSRVSENQRIGKLQAYLVSRLLKIQGVKINGLYPAKVPKTQLARLPNNLNIMIDGVEGEALMLYLDAYGIAVSTGSACTTGMADPSHVLVAIGRSHKEAKSSLRLTMGKQTTRQQLDYLIKVISALIPELRKTKNFLF